MRKNLLCHKLLIFYEYSLLIHSVYSQQILALSNLSQILLLLIINYYMVFLISNGIILYIDNNKSDLQFISLMIGSNDFCTELCWVPSPWSVLEKHKADLLQVLRTLRDNLPRTFVALIPPPHLKALLKAAKDRRSLSCFLTTDFECSCLFGLAFQKSIPLYYEIMTR